VVRRRAYDNEEHIRFVTFSCYRRRKYLDVDQAKRIVIGHLGSKLAKQSGCCLGFVIMPDHVHALVWFPQTGRLSQFMSEWKGQSSHAVKTSFQKQCPNYLSEVDNSEPIWQTRYYGFNI